jgi:hypothetical protein
VLQKRVTPKLVRHVASEEVKGHAAHEEHQSSGCWPGHSPRSRVAYFTLLAQGQRISSTAQHPLTARQAPGQPYHSYLVDNSLFLRFLRNTSQLRKQKPCVLQIGLQHGNLIPRRVNGHSNLGTSLPSLGPSFPRWYERHDLPLYQNSVQEFSMQQPNCYPYPRSHVSIFQEYRYTLYE